MRLPTDMLGERVSRLSVLAYSGSAGGKARWLCVCDCGRLTTAIGNQLRSGKTRSCGCLQREARPRLTHGRSRTPTFTTWVGLRGRCGNPNNQDYPDYGGRGIKCDPRWGLFKNFLADMGERPAGHTLERLDVNGDYGPDNCIWLPAKLQARNRRTARFVILNGERMLSCDAAVKLGYSTSRISQWVTGRAKIPAHLGLVVESRA